MNSKIEEFGNSKQSGVFSIFPGRDIYGELTLAGSNTSLYLRDKESFDAMAISEQCIKGTLNDLTKVTLLDCVLTSGTGSCTGADEKYFFATTFPHFVLFGDRHLNHNERAITEIHFLIEDATVLFYDFDAFGSLIDARPFIESIIQAQQERLERVIPIGPNPAILYFTGKQEIFSTVTKLGKISAWHKLLHTIGGPKGVSLKSRIFTTIQFKEAQTFAEIRNHASTLLEFLELLVGRPQNLLQFFLNISSDDRHPIMLELYWSMLPKYDHSKDKFGPHPAEVLLDAVRQPDAFALVLNNWLNRDETWHDARARFSNLFCQQSYTVDRLIGAANMFDILPAEAVPEPVELSEELTTAKEKCRSIFKCLPKSPEIDTVLSALGRIGEANLKNKIRHRGKFIIDKMEERFPDLLIVSDEAVNCRNHYVHGSRPSFDYSKNFEIVPFFIETLEFIFAASDLVESGWDIRAWCEVPTSLSHPFAVYRVNYRENLRVLMALLFSKINSKKTS